MHDTHYKHVHMQGYKSDFNGVPHLRLRWKVAYVTHISEQDKQIAKKNETPPLQQILKVDKEWFVKCLVCEDSMIMRAFTATEAGRDGFDFLYQ